MYCPRCSQQQISDNVRFCPGCGFQLIAVAQLLSTHGAPDTRTAEARKNVSLLRRKGVRLGAKLIFLSVFLLPPGLWLSVEFDSPGPLMPALIIFLIGLAESLYTIIFGEPDPLGILASPPRELSTNQRLNLPATQGIPIPINEPRRINTAEMARRPSVTEHTTQLLDDNH